MSSEKLAIWSINREGDLHIGRLVRVKGDYPMLTVVSGLMVAHDGSSVGCVVYKSY